MKLFRVSKVEEFFNSYPNAVELFKSVNKQFENSIDSPPKRIPLNIQTKFDGKNVQIHASLSSIVFSDPYEIYYYDICE